MILIDMNQIAVANLMMNLKMNNSKTVDESMVRHMILNSIRMYRKEHHSEYGEVVLTWDSKHLYGRFSFISDLILFRQSNIEFQSKSLDSRPFFLPALYCGK